MVKTGYYHWYKKTSSGKKHANPSVHVHVYTKLFQSTGAVALAEFIADSKHLLRVDLRENDVKTGGLMALSLALKVSESVTRVDLDKEPKKESVCIKKSFQFGNLLKLPYL